METTTTETVDERINRLTPTEELSPGRRESLALAHAAAVDDEVFTKISTALRCSRTSTIVLPPQRFELLSRGRGWCRLGKGSTAQWGERAEGGYAVGPGRWTVGGNDGFHRKGEDVWQVAHITVGADTWTLAW